MYREVVMGYEKKGVKGYVKKEGGDGVMKGGMWWWGWWDMGGVMGNV